ncbi:MAG: hypothetical protein ABWY18_20680 [Tardiphaga sp.]
MFSLLHFIGAAYDVPLSNKSREAEARNFDITDPPENKASGALAEGK